MHSTQFSIVLLLIFFFTTHASSDSNLKNPGNYLIGDISINCGSTTGTSAAVGGGGWTGDSNPKLYSSLERKGMSTTSSPVHKLDQSVDPVPYRTARIFFSQFSYTFHLNSGQKILRFHFYPTAYKGFKKLKDLFSVEAGPFTLLSNFSASETAGALGVNSLVKEFCLCTEENQPLTITFSPENSHSLHRIKSAYAFINGIEIISVPTHLSYFMSGDLGAQVVGEKSLVYIDNKTALEAVHQLHAKRDSSITSDVMFAVSETAPKHRQEERRVLTWRWAVEVGFRYLVRIHFGKIGLEMAAAGHHMFDVLINEITVDSSTEMLKGSGLNGGILRYRDYIVVMKGYKQERKRPLLISLQSNNDPLDEYGTLIGFEIFKLSNLDNSLASPNPESPATYSPSSFIRSLMLVMIERNGIATISILIIVVLNIIVHVLRLIKEARLTNEEKKPSPRAQRLFRCFSLAEIESATENFNHELIIGKGGFGKVYKAQIDNGNTTVAIKRLKFSSRQGANEFWTEIEVLAEVRHKNLVSLIGYCNEQEELILVYEYMAGGTLADHLYKHKEGNNSSSSLTWIQRLKICIGAARGIDYLHTGHGVIHRDVKPSNILLDENFMPKVADFGLAKSEKRGKSQSHVSTNVKGTFGYFDPYYIRTHKLKRESDTYAFGLVLLEVMCGRRAIDHRLGEDQWILSKWVLNCISTNGEVDQCIDSSLMEEISGDSVKTFIGVAERCLHDEPKQRPKMAQVVVQLELALELQDSGKLSVPNEITNIANDPSPSNVESLISEPLTTESREDKVVTPQTEQSNSEMVVPDLQTRNENRKNIKRHKPLRIWRFWNRVKEEPSKKRDALLSDSKLQRFDLAVKEEPSKKQDTFLPYPKLQRFDFATIKAATDSFSNRLPGNYLTYKAVLPSGQAVIVQRFRADFVENNITWIPNCQHENIIKLVGYYIKGEQNMLVYEFMENGSLYTHLYDEVKRSQFGWTLRFETIMGIAKGLLYLHQHSGSGIVHRNLKSENILLDARMNPKISNFEMATIVKYPLKMTMLRFYSDYRCPEYCWEVSDKIDVYSFGIIVLEIVNGKMHRKYGGSNLFDLLGHAWKLWHEAKLVELVDESLNGVFSMEETLRCIQVSLLCTQFKSMDRPTMSRVTNMLLGKECSSVELEMEIARAGQEFDRTKKVWRDFP